jgi:hypothetical protein
LKGSFAHCAQLNTGKGSSQHAVHCIRTITAQRLTPGVPAHAHSTVTPSIIVASPPRITPPSVASCPRAPAFPFQAASFLWPAVRPDPAQYLQSADQATPTPSARITSYSPPIERRRFRAVSGSCSDSERRGAMNHSNRSTRGARALSSSPSYCCLSW